MLGKLKLFWSLFQNGKQVVNKSFWLQQQSVTVPVVMGLLLALVNLGRSYGISLEMLDENTCYMLAGGLYFIINTILLFVTNKRLGVPSRDSTEAQQALPSTEQAIPTEAQPMPSKPVSEPSSRFDEDTIERARKWVEAQRLDDKPGGVFYSP